MKYLLCLLFSSSFIFAQSPIDSLLVKYNKNTVPYIKIEDFKKLKTPIILDTREQKEFDVSHIKNAYCVGYNKFNSKIIKEKYKNFNDTIIVYCSVGIRSETIGNKLKKMGYKNVFNLYGGIFEWKNKEEIVVNNSQIPTENVHAFSKEWSKYLLKGKKIY
ncbi:rhodanese-like domain-containing protein [Flavobacterium sp.]|uniref:rhodanese-like domain-containing protein n=1 Tax=Flavobacterium sp. TaxID=239 RepID=UPI00375320BA